MSGIYTTIEKELRKCKNEEEKYYTLKQLVKDHDLTFEQVNYVLTTARTV